MADLFHTAASYACLGVGLAVLCGFRAFLPVAMLGLFAAIRFVAAPELEGGPLQLVAAPWFVILMFALAVVEIVLNKVAAFRSAAGLALTPVKLLAGGLVLATALSTYGSAVLAVAAVAGIILAFLAHRARAAVLPPLSGDDAQRTGPYLSLLEDIAVLVAVAVVLAFPWSGVILVVFASFLVYRVRTLRRRKYRGLRILKG